MSDLILSSKDRRYVHLLKGNAIGVEMKVLDVVHYHDEMFVLVHCLRRVRIIEKEEEKKFNLRRFVQIEPIFDREEILAFAGNISLACKDAATWQNIDDPIDDFSPTWLRDGGAGTPRSFFKKERMGNTQKLNSNDMNDSLESQIWQQLDRFVQLVRTSRTSGQFDLPPLIQDLRKYASFLPPHRRRLRLSFAIAEMILDLDDRASARQLFLDCTSTADRLQLIIDRLLYDNNQLSAALALEAIRRGANKKHHDK
mmetsp:Transcript_10007/g.13849  ORF Transcript_10007/g.13849 Transcript_10007/m.13849 type:complete len:255 (+) Transcript_10007:339-1103(+)|eukprot:CAMPEP_0197300066 /NCGR_PEP_ID=MMETSP0890-20130614/47533_1 /TAXON_ID=44058 ORGANISM="Aureoumbra lagunensis, Strain CCMP1510" /NCGR_SAMPLE_ID=MMETSP0890 /ASSEMBLY_ACC=CAM_ASM_000533 /LENGTH=254 /DNA_ID=CAMNT_0042778713 /DNA_START=324 /DNA_END=1088 /DNA_ORIENTATION=-